MVCNISIAKFYYKPRYCLIINEEFVIKVPKKTWDELYNYIYEYRKASTVCMSLDELFEAAKKWASDEAPDTTIREYKGKKLVDVSKAPGTKHRKKLDEKE